MPHHSAATKISTCRLPQLVTITTEVRQLNQELWTLLTKPGPISAAEWQLIDEAERAGRTNDDEAGAH